MPLNGNLPSLGPQPPTGSLSVVGGNPATIVSGRQTATTTAAAMPSAALVNGAFIKALSTNTGKIYVGPSGVSATTGYPLAAGEATSVACTNLSAVFIIGDNATDVVAYMGN